MAGDATTMYDAPTGWRAVGRYGLLVVVSVIVLFPVYTGVLVWLGLYLRTSTVRALVRAS